MLIPKSSRLMAVVAVLSILIVLVPAETTISSGSNRPVVAVYADLALVAEEAPYSPAFVIIRGGASMDQPLTVSYTLSGTASNGVDYEYIGSKTTIAAGAASTYVVVVPKNDTLPESNESIALTLNSSTNYDMGLPKSATITILDNYDRTNSINIANASIKITSPSNNSAFTAPANINIKATAIDPYGEIDAVSFWANNSKIGESLLYFDRLPIPGLPVEHVFEWKSVPAGQYAINVRGTNSLGQPVISPSVNISVRASTNYPTVTVVTIDPEAAESPNSAGITNTGAFSVSRSGDFTRELLVQYRVEGTASNGVDYVYLSGKATISSSQSNATIVVRPLYDTRVEGPETVRLVLKSSELYKVGTPSNAVVTIADATTVPNRPPVVSITSPLTNATLIGPTNITIKANVSDPDGWITMVEFFRGTNRLGFATNTSNALPVVEPVRFTWTNAPVGVHILTAKATDNRGAQTVSAPVNIRVLPATDAASIVFITPTNGASYAAPATVPIYTVATDPKGAMYLVSYFANDIFIGRSAIYTLVPSIPGTPMHHHFTWSNVIAGTYILSAKATNSLGKPVVSEPVKITVTAPPDLPVITVEAIDSLAAEKPRPDGSVNIGAFAFLRSGNTSKPLTLNYNLGGTAKNGTDYTSMPNSVMLPAGVTMMSISVNPLKDNLVEGDETVVLTMKPGDGYRVGSPSNAVVTIVDSSTTNRPPVVAITQPANHAQFSSPTNILIKAYADDPEGWIRTVEFWKGSTKLGAATNELALPHKNLFEFTWVNAPAGEHSLTAKATDNLGAQVTSAPVAINIKGSTSPGTINIVSPTNGTTYSSPATISISAVATDPNGYISTVAFFANSNFIGHSTIVFVRAPDPGTPIQHHLNWSNVLAGSYVLTAKATNSQGRLVASAEPKTVVVSGPNIKPVISVVASDPEASEIIGANGTVNTGAFTIRRTGGQAAVKVYYSLSGNALPGLDYQSLPGYVQLAQNSTSAVVTIYPKQDTIVEGNESVVLTLKSDSQYQIGSPEKATVTIIDNPIITNLPPVVQIVYPTNHQEFRAPTNITLRATASDQDDKVKTVQFFNGTNSLGFATNNPITVPPGNYYFLTWSNVPAGEHILRAQAMDDLGAGTVSEPVTIKVIGQSSTNSFVSRDLPDRYVPGIAFTVKLAAQPAKGVTVYAVEDQPPTGWTVKSISHDGLFDTANHKVKFGPFFDSTARTLTYQAMPPTNAFGLKEFVGNGSADGVISPIKGDHAIGSVLRHPADVNPADNRMTITEVTAYGQAWKLGQPWPVDPNPIPLSYLTRAGALWKGGEAYHVDPTKDAAPLWWVNDSIMTMAGALSLDNLTGGAGTATRELPRRCKASSLMTVTVLVTPAATIGNFAVEETVPDGCAVSLITEDGVFDPAARRIRWGPFMDRQQRTLSYQIEVRVAAAGYLVFDGAASFDGRDVPITNQRTTIVETGIATLSPKSVQLLPDGMVMVTFRARSDQEYIIERSMDLQSWTTIATEKVVDGLIQFIDTEAKDLPHCYYRARLANPVLRGAIQALAGHLNQRVESFQVVSIAQTSWGDTSLGCPEPGVAYAQVITSGWEITLNCNGVIYELHTGLTGAYYIWCQGDPRSARPVRLGQRL